MAIEVTCECGKRLRAADDQAGCKVRCPSCQAVVRVPGEEEGGYGVEAVRKCPGCRREWPADAAVCIDCGYDFRTGRKMRTKFKTRDRVVEMGVSWLGTTTRYRVWRDERGKPALSIAKSFLFIPLGTKTYHLKQFNAIL